MSGEDQRVKPVVLGHGEGRKIGERPTGGGVTLKLGADDTAGAASIYESLRLAGDLGGPPMHRHAFDEAFYVLEGDYVFNVEGRTIARLWARSRTCRRARRMHSVMPAMEQGAC
jgi:mannose-6-phosphate isomerase-like protein (cupin superfamily)